MEKETIHTVIKISKSVIGRGIWGMSCEREEKERPLVKDHVMPPCELFARTMLSLTKLTRKGQAFVWDAQCEHSFQTLKEKLTTAPVLVLPNPREPIEVYCEASKMG